MSAISDFISDFNTNGRIFWSGPAQFKGGRFSPFNSGKLPIVRGGAATGTETATLTNYSSGYGSIPPYLYGDDSDDFVESTVQISLSNSGEISIVWAGYIKELDGHFLWAMRDGADDLFDCYTRADGSIQVRMKVGGTQKTLRTAAGIAESNTWHRYTFTIDNSGVPHFYRDGAETTPYQDQETYTMGDYTFTDAIDFNGLNGSTIANVVTTGVEIWCCARTAAQESAIAALGEKMGGLEMRNLDFTEGTATLHTPEDDTSTAPAPARFGDHTQAVAITVPSRAVAAADVNVPLAVNLAELMPAGFWSSIDFSGDEMVATKQGGTEVNCDLVAFNRAAQTGHLKVQWHELSTTEDTTLYIQYGGTTNRSVTATDTYKSCYNENVDHDFWFAMDMASGHLIDRVGNHTSTAETNLSYGEDGVVGDAIEMNGNNSNAVLGVLPYAGRTSLTMLHWMKQSTVDIADFIFDDDVDGDNRIIVRTSGTGNGQYTVDLDNGGNAIGSIDYVDNGYAAGTWGQFGFVYDNSAGATNEDKLKIFQNHDTPTVTFAGTIPSSLADVSAQNATIGRASASLDGLLDELRSVLAALTSDQVAQAHYNEYFFTVGGGMVASGEPISLLGGLAKSDFVFGTTQFRL